MSLPINYEDSYVTHTCTDHSSNQSLNWHSVLHVYSLTGKENKIRTRQHEVCQYEHAVCLSHCKAVSAMFAVEVLCQRLSLHFRNTGPCQGQDCKAHYSRTAYHCVGLPLMSGKPKGRDTSLGMSSSFTPSTLFNQLGVFCLPLLVIPGMSCMQWTVVNSHISKSSVVNLHAHRAYADNRGDCDLKACQVCY